MWIFIRLISSTYVPKSPANIGKSLAYKAIRYINVNSMDWNHSAINTKLTDDYLTMEPRLMKESLIRAVETKGVDPDKTFIGIFGLEVTEDEYNQVNDYINKALANSDKFSYYWQDYPRLGIHILKNRITDKYYSEPEFNTYRFVCSTLVAYILYQSVGKVRDWYLANDLHPLDTSPAELVYLPDIRVLYQCKLTDYMRSTMEFVARHPEFRGYI